MSEQGESTENISAVPQKVDLTHEQNGRLLGSHVLVDGEILGFDLWEELLDKTQKTGFEHGIIIASQRGEILTSRIAQGFNEEDNYGNRKLNMHSITFPFLPYGLKSIDPRVRELVSVHTHPALPEFEHLPSTKFSAGDIQEYASKRLTAMVMIEKGGVHLLTGRDNFNRGDVLDAKKLVTDSFDKAENGSRTIAEVRKYIAEGLYLFGIRYYFTSRSELSGERLIHFRDCRI